MITIKNIDKFKNSIIVPDDIGSEFSRHIKYYFTEERHKNIQTIILCHKPAQRDNMSRMDCNTLYIRTYNGPDLFQNLNTTYKCDHKFHEIISELNSSYYSRTNGMADELRYGMIKYNIKERTFIVINKNRTMIYYSRIGFMDLKALSLKDELDSKEIDKLIAYMKPLTNKPSDRNTINAENYQFYFNKLLASRDIKIQYDVLTKETVKADGIKILSTIRGIIASFFMIYNCIKPDPAVRTAAQVTAHSSHMINRTGALLNYGLGEERSPTSYQEYEHEEYIYQGSCFIDEETEALNKRGRDNLNNLYNNNQKFKNENINFISDETELSNEKIVDKRF